MKMITSEMEKQIVRFTEDAAGKAAKETVASLAPLLEKKATQKAVIEKGDKLQAAIMPAVQQALSAVLGQFLIDETEAYEASKVSILIKVGGSNPYFDQQFDYWMDLWAKKLGIKNPNFLGLTPFVEHAGYRPLVLPKHELITPQFLYDCCKERFNGKCWKWYDDSLDKIVTKNDRDPRAGAYVVWFKDVVEADENLKNLSANKLAEMSIPGITLFEREVMEYDRFNRSNGHLDIDNITLCSGSRYDDGYVPDVRWRDDKMRVDWYHPDRSSDHLRSRQQFSF